MQKSKFLLGILALLGVILTLGCDSSSDREDLEIYVRNIKKLSNKKLEDLPNEIPDVTYAYSGVGKRSPFETPEQFVRGQINTIADDNRPDSARSKEVLEKFEIKDLKMVGSLQKADGTYWALIKDKQDMVYKIKLGSYIGKNDGKVTKVSDKEIEINELIPNSFGGWKNNTVIMPLIE